MLKNLSIFIVVILFSACSVEPLKPVEVDVTAPRVDYLNDVKPILDRRCVVCHSCYNSPCQLKLSSFEGLDRGASKDKVYLAERLSAQDPSRLFMDADSTQEWREKGFNSVSESDSEDGTNNSLMLLLLEHKMQNPKNVGSYYSESDDVTCAKDRDELASFLDKNPHSGMPFGFPPLSESEFETIKRWLAQGAISPNKTQMNSIKSASKTAQKQIYTFEEFLNKQDPKHIMSARYIYEHLFLAHIAFEGADGEFFELVRSKTPSPQAIEIIATVRPYDDPQVDKFYYRFRKIHSTIVHKTHMVYDLSEKKLLRYKELFIEPEWEESPFIVGYKQIYNTDPFRVFGQIPASSRYEFLLDNAEYVIRTFIRGPVCKGQIALNVIHDNFWVMFMAPEYDLSLKNRDFFKNQYENLRMPIEDGSTVGLLSTFSDKYIDAAILYNQQRQELYDETYKNGLDISSIWRGKDASSAPFLSIYRHFDSASVYKGALGGLPRTAWVLDYPLFERIYYALVAGFDIYGNVGHQVSTRRYMSRLRVEGETNFLNLLPQVDRQKYLDSWHLNAQNKEAVFLSKNESAIEYKKIDSKRELLERIVDKHLLKSCGIEFDKLNYFYANERVPTLPNEYKTKKDYHQAFKSLVKEGLAFIKMENGYSFNLAYIRIKNIPDMQDIVASAVVNRWHDNVSFMFKEDKRLDPSKDEFDFVEGFVGSYPNMFLVVDYKDLPDFFDLLHNYDASKEYKIKFLKYGVLRSDEDFWKTYDWFQDKFFESNPKEAGLLDLNRYYHRAFDK
ncbi:MAG: fatty acid cis/trans isomerase [Sulfurimonas sp.]|uniref:fatty acid cis/trans isomerase n=1 Tax=Sulfurimonas sp. TaxID=2022749 RepID=UPI0025D038B4|nr:fatty acid cis/trans isomerase [Sulfurimonas sp.]MCK9491953.1 fatty acid cis/trans isomerase [Sulfurimonas sp.]